METNIKFNYPSSEKVYLSGKLYPEIKVGMRKVSLTPTITVEGGERRVEPNDPVYVYDTSGPYSDPNVEIDLEKGLPKLRQSWIDGRKEGETQMYFAKQGVITQEMEYVAIRENMNCEVIYALIPCNMGHNVTHTRYSQTCQHNFHRLIEY